MCDMVPLRKQKQPSLKIINPHSPISDDERRKYGLGTPKQKISPQRKWRDGDNILGSKFIKRKIFFSWASMHAQTQRQHVSKIK